MNREKSIEIVCRFVSVSAHHSSPGNKLASKTEQPRRFMGRHYRLWYFKAFYSLRLCSYWYICILGLKSSWDDWIFYEPLLNIAPFVGEFYLKKHLFSIKAYNTVEFSIRILWFIAFAWTLRTAVTDAGYYVFTLKILLHARRKIYYLQYFIRYWQLLPDCGSLHPLYLNFPECRQ